MTSTYIQNNDINTKKIEEGLVKAENYAVSLINNKSQWGCVPVLPHIMNFLSKIGLNLASTDIHQKYLKFNADRSSCTRCGLCEDICPVNNITMEEFPVTGNKCEYCMRCVSMCPVQPIRSIVTYNGKTYSAVEPKDFKK